MSNEVDDVKALRRLLVLVHQHPGASGQILSPLPQAPSTAPHSRHVMVWAWTWGPAAQVQILAQPLANCINSSFLDLLLI